MNELDIQALPLLPLTTGVVLPGMVVTLTIESDEARAAVLWGEGASGNEIHLRIPTGHVASGAAHNETASIQASNWITYRGP